MYYCGNKLTKDVLEEFNKNTIDLPENLSFIGKCKRGTLNLACAKTGVGKSWFLMQFAACLSLQYNVLYISLENDLGTDLERILMLRTVYPNCIGESFVYTTEEVWHGIEWLNNKELLKNFDFVIIDGLDYCVDVGPDKSFDTYKQLLKELQSKFCNSCIWLSWQMGRKFESGEPTIEDIAFSYAAARLAYNAIAIYKDKAKNRIISNIKCRGIETNNSVRLVWGQDFIDTNKASAAVNNTLNNLIDRLKEANFNGRD